MSVRMLRGLPISLPRASRLALLAWGATQLLDETARSWFEHDVAARARLSDRLSMGRSAKEARA